MTAPIVAPEVVAERVATALAQLKAIGKRTTVSRRVLLGCLFEGGSHRTATALTEAVQAIAPDIHASTVYRNLDELTRIGIIEHIHFGHGPVTYHLTLERHGHFACEDCDDVFEAGEEYYVELARFGLANFDLIIQPHHFTVIGVCRACAAERIGD
jgi:Fur family transcriptional regulator, ferric uptake regulator